jgi:hypothetical protein
VATHPGGQQLVGAQPQHLTHRRVDVAGGPVAAQVQDRVVGLPPAQRAVGQLGGQRGVAALDPAFPQQGRQQQVGVGVPLVDGGQHVVGDPPHRVGAGGPAAARAAG